MSGIAEIGIRVFLDNVAAGGLAQLSSQLLQVSKNTQNAGNAMKEMQAAAISGALVGFGAVLLGIGEGAKYAVQSAEDFQQALFNMAVATHVPYSEAQKYTQALMNLGATSIFTTADIVTGIAAMGRSGFTLNEIMSTANKAGLSMAQVGIEMSIAIGSDAVTGFKLLSQVMSAYHQPASQALNDANLIQYAFEHQRGSVADFAVGMSQITPEAARFHVGLNEIGPALDIVSSSMASTGRAGTALRYMLDGLYSPTAGAQKEMVQLGLGAVDAGGNFHSAFFDAKGNALDLMKSLQILKDKLNGLTQEQQIEALHNLFSVRGGQGVEVTLNQFDKLTASIKTLKENADNAGMVQQRFNEKMQLLQPSMQALQTSFTDLAVVIGLAIIPAVTQFVQWVNNTVSAIRSWAVAHSAAIPSLMGLMAAVAGLGVVISVVMLLFANPVIAVFVGAMVGAVAVSVGVAMALQRLIPWFQQLMSGSSMAANIIRFLIQTFQVLWSQITTVVVQAFNQLKSNLAGMGVDFTGLATLAKFLGAVLGAVAIILIGVLLASILAVVRGLTQFISGLVMIIAGIAQWVAGVVQVFQGFWQMVIGLFTGNWSMVRAGWQNFLTGLVNIARGMFMVITGIFQAVLGTIIGVVVGFVQGIINWFQHLSTVLVGHSIIPDMLNAIHMWFVSIWQAIIAYIVSVVASITNAINAMGIAWRIIWSAIGVIVQQGINNVVTFVQGLPGRIQGALAGLASMMYNWGHNAMQMFANGLASALGAVISQVQQAATTVANFMAHHSPAKMGPMSDDDKWMPNMMMMFANDIKRHGPVLADALHSATSNMSNIPSISRSVAPAQGTQANGGNTYVTFNIDGTPMAQVVINKLTGQLQTGGLGRILH